MRTTVTYSKCLALDTSFSHSRVCSHNGSDVTALSDNKTVESSVIGILIISL